MNKRNTHAAKSCVLQGFWLVFLERGLRLFSSIEGLPMLLSRILPKSQNPDFARTQAVFITLVLIVLALALPFWLSSFFPNGTPDTTKNLITGAVVLLISWDMVNDIVGAAISAAKEKGIKDYLKNNSSDGIREKQDLEFYAMLPIDSRRGSLSLERVHDEQELEVIKKNVIARELIVRTLGNDDELLQAIALRACLKELKMENASDDEIKVNTDLIIFQKDIYIYLKAWLIQSIKHERIMPIEDIKQRYRSELNPNKLAYINVLTSIKDKWMKRRSVQDCLSEEYREKANVIIDEYMGRLITEIRNYNQKNTPRLR